MERLPDDEIYAAARAKVGRNQIQMGSERGRQMYENFIAGAQWARDEMTPRTRPARRVVTCQHSNTSDQPACASCAA